MIKRICLITPPSIFLLDERVFMTLGILKVAAVLEQTGVEVEMLDLSGVENYEEVVRDHVRGGSVTCYGLTATTPQMPAATKVYRVIRALDPSARIILGGPHVTLIHAAYKYEQKRGASGRATTAFRLLEEMYDVLVVGDGEIAIFDALGENPLKLVDGDDPKSELFLTNQKLTELPFPARHLIDVDSYQYTIDGVRALSMIAQLGCPFGCGFCGGRMSPFLRRIRMRTSENMVQEMVQLYKTYGVTGFMLYDDELNVNPKIVELMELIAKAQRDLGVEFRLRGFIKAELFTDQQAEAMYKAGFRWILVGFESGHERILTNIQKKASQADNTRAMDVARRHNLKVKALMSVGHPGESEETVRATRDWLLEVKPADFDATVITTYPGTPYFDEAVETKPGVWTYTYAKTGDRLHSIEVDYREVAEYYKGVPGEYTSYVYTDHLSAKELVQQRDWLEADVRGKLGIPYNAGAPAVRYEHSMGQGVIPANILRSTAPAGLKAV
ncbi:MAG: B12-binding domain-containing radical SAM protein [Nitrospirae bacterium]|nr:B12-binding domain-containing radical SAM protein [Nitrospirota bacterium]